MNIQLHKKKKKKIGQDHKWYATYCVFICNGQNVIKYIAY